MKNIEKMGSKRRKSMQVLVCAFLVLSMQVNAYAQYSNCDVVKYSVKSAYDEKSNAIKNKSDQTNGAMDTAMSCIDALKLALNFAMPTGWSLQGITLEAIMAYLSKKACAVVLEQVGTIVAPINQVVRDVNGVTQGAASMVNGVSTSVGGANVLSSTGPVSAAGIFPPAQGPGAFSAGPVVPAVKSAGVWDKVGCTFSFGQNC